MPPCPTASTAVSTYYGISFADVSKPVLAHTYSLPRYSIYPFGGQMVTAPRFDPTTGTLYTLVANVTRVYDPS